MAGAWREPGGARDGAMSSGGELAFVALHGVVKFLDTVFWVFGKGLIAAALAVVGLVARAILGEDAVAQTGAHGVADGRRGRDSRDEALAELLSGPVDRRVSEAAKGDAKKLREKHSGWCEWYADHDVGTLLDREKPAFEIVKAFYPHAFHGVTKRGFAVQLEKPGRFPTLLAELRKRGFADPTRAVVEHVSFIMTHAFDAIDQRDFPLGRILRIVDMSRLDLSDTGYEAYVFLKAMAHVSSVAFPERVHKVVIVNPPAAFNVLWGVFSPMVSARTMARVRICKDTQSAKKALLEDLELRDIPREYGGECECGARRRRKKNGADDDARDGGRGGGPRMPLRGVHVVLARRAARARALEPRAREQRGGARRRRRALGFGARPPEGRSASAAIDGRRAGFRVGAGISRERIGSPKPKKRPTWSPRRRRTKGRGGRRAQKRARAGFDGRRRDAAGARAREEKPRGVEFAVVQSPRVARQTAIAHRKRLRRRRDGTRVGAAGVRGAAGETARARRRGGGAGGRGG